MKIPTSPVLRNSDQLVEHMEQRRYLQEFWGSFLLLAGYENVKLTPEGAHLLGGTIMRALQPAVYARSFSLKQSVVGAEDYFDALNEMSAEQKTALRAEIGAVCV
jgi:hypothetical protein